MERIRARSTVTMDTYQQSLATIRIRETSVVTKLIDFVSRIIMRIRKTSKIPSNG